MVRIRSCVPRFNTIGLLLNCASHKSALMRATNEFGNKKPHLILHLWQRPRSILLCAFLPSLEDSSTAASESHKVHLCQHEAYTYTLSLSYHRYMRTQLPSTGTFFHCTVPSPCLNAPKRHQAKLMAASQCL
jgi:hypothetical protein